MLEMEQLEDRICPAVVASFFAATGQLVVTGALPNQPHQIVLTDRSITADGREIQIDPDHFQPAVKSILFLLGDGFNTVLNYSAFPTIYQLGNGPNIIYGGRGADLVQVLPHGTSQHGYDIVVDPYGANAIDVHQGPSLVITNPQSAVWADHVAEVFRILVKEGQ